MPRLAHRLCIALATFCSACTSRVPPTGATAGQRAADGGGGYHDAASAAGDGHVAADGGAPMLSLTTRTAAVTRTAQTNATCTALPAFYWEIGDVTGALASGAVGNAFSADTQMPIASASKLIFGAYVVERFKDDLSQLDQRAMRMLSGYTSLNYTSCVGKSTVSDCLNAGNNGVHTAANDDFFFYDGGHFQKYAVDLGLGDDDNVKLAADLKTLIGGELAFTYGSPQLAGGVRTTASDYALFLRKILAGKLALSAHLGEHAVCTLPSVCPAAKSSPATRAWHYSYGHWVEDEPSTGDGAFSSPGAFGFYPWIDATKTYYGILARYSLAAQAYLQSAECGRLLRRAFTTGMAP